MDFLGFGLSKHLKKHCPYTKTSSFISKHCKHHFTISTHV